MEKVVFHVDVDDAKQEEARCTVQVSAEALGVSLDMDERQVVAKIRARFMNQKVFAIREVRTKKISLE